MKIEKLLGDYSPLLFLGMGGIAVAAIGGLIGVSVVWQWYQTGLLQLQGRAIAAALLVLLGAFMFIIGLILDLLLEIEKRIKN